MFGLRITRTMSRRIYVGKISSRTRESDIKDRFSDFGEISSCEVKRGFAFVVCFKPFICAQQFQLFIKKFCLFF